MSTVIDLTGLRGRVRGTGRPAYSDGDEKIPGMTPQGELLVVAGLPDLAELVRQGQTWQCAIPTSSAFTYVNAWPTTRAELVLRNSYTDDTHLVIERAWMVDISSAAAAQSKALLAQLVSAHAAVTDDTAALITSRSGKSAYTGSAERDLALTTMTANKWELVAAGVTANTATIGTGLVANMCGWIVKPGAALGLAGVASTAAGTAIIGVVWHEVPMRLP